MCKILKRVFYAAFHRVVYRISYSLYIRSIGDIVYKAYPTRHSIIRSVGHCIGCSIGYIQGVFLFQRVFYKVYMRYMRDVGGII